MLSADAGMLDDLGKAIAAEKAVAWMRLPLIAIAAISHLVLSAGDHVPPDAADVVLIVVTVYAAAVLLIEPYRRFDVRWSSRVTTALDTSAAIVWVYATGGYSSPFYIVLYVAMILVAYRFSLRETMFVAFLCGAAYTLMVAADGGLVAHAGDVLVRVGYLLCSALIAGVLAREVFNRGIALRASRDYQMLRNHFIEGVLSAQDEERRRLARELHDETGQSLASLVVGLRTLEEAKSLDEARQRTTQLRQIAERTVDEIGRLARGLHPSVLDDLGFSAALTRYSDDWAEAHELAMDLHVRGIQSPDNLPRVVSTALYRIVQEALNNVAKHANARNVCIIVDREERQIRVVIEDDGRGFDPEAPTHGKTHLGLQSIRERVGLLKGALAVESAPGEGTTLAVTVPLQGP